MHFDHIVVPGRLNEFLNHACFDVILSRILDALKGTPSLTSVEFEKTKSLRAVLTTNLTSESGWVRQLVGIDAIPSNLHNQNYVIDFSSDYQSEVCSERHRVLLEICFDNRQAIGTNIFKLETAAKNFREKTGGDAVGIIICGDRKSLKVGGWDAGVADEEEYQVALGTAYGDYLSSSISLLVLRA